MPPGSRRECSLFEINNEKETERAGDFTLTIRAEISNVKGVPGPSSWKADYTILRSAVNPGLTLIGAFQE